MKSYGNWSGGGADLTNIKSVATSASGFIALDHNGVVHKFGSYQNDNSQTKPPDPGDAGFVPIKEIFAGGYGGYGAITEDGDFFVWGYGADSASDGSPIVDNKSEAATGIGFEYGNVSILFEDNSTVEFMALTHFGFCFRKWVKYKI